MSSFWSDLGIEPINKETKALKTNVTGNFWQDLGIEPAQQTTETLPQTSEEKLKQKLKQPGAYVKGLGKGFSKLPGLPARLSAYLARQLTPEDAPWRKWIEEKTAPVLESETPMEKSVRERLEKKLPASKETEFAERAGERTAPYLFSSNPLLGMLMGGAGQAAEEAGLGPLGQILTEMGTGLGAGALAKGTSLLKPALQAKPLLTKEGLQLPQAAYKKPSRLIKPIAMEGTKEAAMERIGKQIDEIIAPIKEKAIPETGKMTAEQLESKATGVLKHVDQMANRLTGEVSPTKATNVKNYLNQQKKILKRAKVPAEETKKVLNKINSFEAMYAPLVEHSPADMLYQFREINQDLKNIYKNWHITGAQDEMKSFLEGLNRAFAKDIERDFAKEGAFVKRFKQGNELWKQHKKLQEYESFMDSITKEDKIDPSLFRKEVMTKGGKNKITKALGKENYEKLSNLANDIKKAEVGLKEIKGFDLTKRMVSNYLLNAIFKLVGVDKIFKGIQIPKYALGFAKGILLTKPAVYRNTRLLLNAVKNNNVNAIGPILERLDKETRKEIK